MRQIQYNTTATTLRLEYPAEWDVTTLTDVKITVKDQDGADLLAATSCTEYTATTLAEDADQYADEIVLASTAGDLKAGDAIHLSGVEQAEIHRVRGYDTVSKTAQIEGILEFEHLTGDTVRGLWCTYSLNTSTTTTFTAGLYMTIVWTPYFSTVAGTSITEAAQIAKVTLDLAGIEKRFSRLYPRAYDAFKDPYDRFADMLAEAEGQVRQELQAAAMDTERLIDQGVIAPATMAKMAFLWTFSGDEAIKDERDFYASEYDKQIAIVKALPVWQDIDQDYDKDDDEVTTNEATFENGW